MVRTMQFVIREKLRKFEVRSRTPIGFDEPVEAALFLTRKSSIAYEVFCLVVMIWKATAAKKHPHSVNNVAQSALWAERNDSGTR